MRRAKRKAGLKARPFDRQPWQSTLLLILVFILAELPIALLPGVGELILSFGLALLLLALLVELAECGLVAPFLGLAFVLVLELARDMSFTRGVGTTPPLA